MRLSECQVTTIKAEIKKIDSKAKVYLFGSRVDDEALGGDIDLLVISNNINFSKKIKIQAQLFVKLDEQQVDLLVVENADKPFVKLALLDGILL